MASLTWDDIYGTAPPPADDSAMRFHLQSNPTFEQVENPRWNSKMSLFDIKKLENTTESSTSEQLKRLKLPNYCNLVMDDRFALRGRQVTSSLRENAPAMFKQGVIAERHFFGPSNKSHRVVNESGVVCEFDQHVGPVAHAVLHASEPLASLGIETWYAKEFTVVGEGISRVPSQQSAADDFDVAYNNCSWIVTRADVVHGRGAKGTIPTGDQTGPGGQQPIFAVTEHKDVGKLWTLRDDFKDWAAASPWGSRYDSFGRDPLTGTYQTALYEPSKAMTAIIQQTGGYAINHRVTHVAMWDHATLFLFIFEGIKRGKFTTRAELWRQGLGPTFSLKIVEDPEEQLPSYIGFLDDARESIQLENSVFPRRR
ncbi:hypothetical protein K4K58_008951 [Colletotrichum sp. SAR11_239]|nr:hypothetical protein K4K58_008951 [Colletotrichum sp. SAR11_239]